MHPMITTFIVVGIFTDSFARFSYLEAELTLLQHPGKR
jgi:hypothetical protein